MGNSESKSDVPPLPKPKEGDIKIDLNNLPKLEPVKGFDIPKPPQIMTSSDRKREEEKKAMEGKVPFNIKKEFDQSTYTGRFMMQFTRLNPMLFFYSDKSIKEAQDKVFKYSTRLEAAENMGSEVMMRPEEIEDIRLAYRIVGGSVHPDTNEIIPRVMRLSGFVVFNVPIATLVIFMPNQTPLTTGMLQWINQTYNAGMNYGNRNASTAYTTSDLANGYIAACLVSIGIAMGSRYIFANFLKRQ